MTNQYKCYKCNETLIPDNTYSLLCNKCIKAYNKTWYYGFSRMNTYPKNLISARPVRLFGIYLFSILHLAKNNYEWSCIKSYDPENPDKCRCKKHKTN